MTTPSKLSASERQVLGALMFPPNTPVAHKTAKNAAAISGLTEAEVRKALVCFEAFDPPLVHRDIDEKLDIEVWFVLAAAIEALEQPGPEPFWSPLGLVFTTSAVMHEGLPVLLVTHDADDQAWQLVNGHGDTEEGMLPILVHASHLLDLDASLAPLADLPVGWHAWRPSKDADWIREPRPPG